MYSGKRTHSIDRNWIDATGPNFLVSAANAAVESVYMAINGMPPNNDNKGYGPWCSFTFAFYLLRGYTNVSREGREYYGYLKEPYGAPPLGRLRFPFDSKDPVEALSWTVLRDNDKHSAKRFRCGRRRRLSLRQHLYPKLTN